MDDDTTKKVEKYFRWHNSKKILLLKIAKQLFLWANHFKDSFYSFFGEGNFKFFAKLPI